MRVRAEIVVADARVALCPYLALALLLPIRPLGGSVI
jgi:hypothetical protein